MIKTFDICDAGLLKIYAATDVANHCGNFRYRIRENRQVVLHDRVHPSFTEMSRDGDDDLFKLLTVEVSSTGMTQCTGSRGENTFRKVKRCCSRFLYRCTMLWSTASTSANTSKSCRNTWIASDDLTRSISQDYFRNSFVLSLRFQKSAT